MRNELSIRADEQLARHHSFRRKRKTCFRFPAQNKCPSCAIQKSQTRKGPLVTAALDHLICLCTRFIGKKSCGCTTCPLQKLVVLLITHLIAQNFDPKNAWKWSNTARVFMGEVQGCFCQQYGTCNFHHFTTPIPPFKLFRHLQLEQSTHCTRCFVITPSPHRVEVVFAQMRGKGLSG